MNKYFSYKERRLESNAYVLSALIAWELGMPSFLH